MVLKRIYWYLFLIGLALICSACASVNPTELAVGSPVVSQYAQGTSAVLPAATAVITQPPASSTPSGTTTQEAGFADEWSIYSSDTEPRFSFEFPSLYNTDAYSACKITQGNSANYLLYLRFGFRSELAVATNDLHSLDSYVERWKQGMDVQSEEIQTINGLPGVTIDYRFGGTNRFGSSTFISQDDLIYIFNFTAGETCDLAEINLTELMLYKHAIETFKLSEDNL